MPDVDSAAWSAQQLAEYLAVVSSLGDERRTMFGAVELAAEAFEAEVGAVLCGDQVLAAVGFPAGRTPGPALAESARRRSPLDVPGPGPCPVLSVPLELPDGAEGALLLARSSAAFDREEASLARAMARVVSLTLRNLSTMASLRARQELLERLSKIQRAISLRQPLPDVFQQITSGTADLLGDNFVTLYLVDSKDPGWLTAAAMHGMPEVTTLDTARLRVGSGVTGRSVAEDRLIVAQDYASHPDANSQAVALGVSATIAAPVHASGEVIGCLVAGSVTPGRSYSGAERDLLTAFAEHASLAVTDAATVEALHEAVGDANHRAQHDPLTGLANRARFLDRLSHVLSVRRAPGVHIAVLYVDLDDFKMVNDRFGHAVGDLLLVEAAGRLNAAVRVGDTVARLGGDEFAVLVENVAVVDEASVVADRILDSFTKPFVFGDVAVACNVSVGLAMRETSSWSADELLRNADVAMYRAKNSGKGCSVVFESAMYEALLDRLELESDLRHVVEADGIEVYFQPILRIEDEKVVGVEALARWLHPERGFVPPVSFIPLAEDTGLILDLGRQVLARACAWAGSWRRAHPEDDLYLSVNLSAQQLHDPSLVDAVRRALDQAGIPPSALVLEITESVLMQDTGIAGARLRELKQLGLRLALDDFGTGYSSLSYLRRFDVDILKIDRSFVSTLHTGAELHRLTEAILALGGALGLECLAEGVEQEVELEALRELGCEMAQGHYFAGPLPVPILEEYLTGKVHSVLHGLAS